MPTSGEIGTHESISAELETHEMPTCGEILSPRFMFAKLETHQTPTIAEIETLGMDFQVYQHASESLIAFGWRLPLEGSHNNSSNEYLTGEESASKYGVGLCSGNTVRVQFTAAPRESDYCLVLHNLVEYLMLKKGGPCQEWRSMYSRWSSRIK